MLGITSDMLCGSGRPVTLRRLRTSQTPVDVTVQAFIRDFRPNELVGNIIQGDRRVIISNDEIAAAAWPSPIRKGDQVIDGTIVMVVQSAEPVTLGEETVRHNMIARG